MKKKILSIVFAMLCLTASACSGGTGDTQEDTAPEVRNTVNAEPSDITSAVLVEIPINSAIEKGLDDLSMYFTELDTTGLESVSYYMCASGAYPDEIAVMKFTSEELAGQGRTAVQSRLDKQISVYESYTPDEMYKLEGAIIETNGNYLYYLVTSDNAKAEEIVKGFLG